MASSSESKTAILREEYTTTANPAAFASVQKLLKAARLHDPSITKQDVDNFLKAEPSYTLYGVRRKNYLRLPVYVAAPCTLLSADLVDMQNLANFNSGFRYILVVIDVYSRFAVFRLLKDKRGPTVAESFRDIFEKGVFRSPRYLWVDRGGEFLNRHLDRILATFNIKRYSTFNYDSKASYAERFIRTLRNKLSRTMTYHNTKKYIDFCLML